MELDPNVTNKAESNKQPRAALYLGDDGFGICDGEAGFDLGGGEGVCDGHDCTARQHNAKIGNAGLHCHGHVYCNSVPWPPAPPPIVSPREGRGMAVPDPVP